MAFGFFKPSANSLASSEGTAHSTRRKQASSLVWTFWIFAVPLFETGNAYPDWLWPTLASLAVFLYLYYRVYYGDRARILGCVLGMAALGFAVTPFNPGAQTYLIYACAYAAFVEPTRKGMFWMFGLLAAYALEWGVLLLLPWGYASDLLIGLIIWGINVNLLRQRAHDAELRLSHEEVRRLAATAERERIGRDLHDLLGHTLSLIVLKSELANKQFGRDPAVARREMIEVEQVAREALAQVRGAVSGIRAAEFAAELASAKLRLESSGVRWRSAVAEVNLPRAIETALAMAVREAVTNIQRHARAKQAQVTLDAELDTLILRIEDDGRGGATVPGNGLAGMRERLDAIGARLDIRSQRGQGTKLEIVVPYPRSEREPPKTAASEDNVRDGVSRSPHDGDEAFPESRLPGSVREPLKTVASEDNLRDGVSRSPHDGDEAFPNPSSLAPGSFQK